MTYRVEIAADATRDLVAIFDFLVESYIEFGEHPDDAMDRAERRIDQIKERLRSLGTTPKQGTLRPEIRSGLRNVTKDRAVMYFDVDDDKNLVRALAVFLHNASAPIISPRERGVLAYATMPDGCKLRPSF